MGLPDPSRVQASHMVYKNRGDLIRSPRDTLFYSLESFFWWFSECQNRVLICLSRDYLKRHTSQCEFFPPGSYECQGYWELLRKTAFLTGIIPASVLMISISFSLGIRTGDCLKRSPFVKLLKVLWNYWFYQDNLGILELSSTWFLIGLLRSKIFGYF